MHRDRVAGSDDNAMRRLGGRAMLLGSLALAPLACVPGRGVELGAFPGVSRETPAGGVSSHVVIVSIDGLRPDAIGTFGAGTLQRLMQEGAYTLSATTILPSKTLPSHTSMLTGEDVDEHGITWNSNQVGDHGHVEVPTIFDVAHERGFHTAAFFSKTKFEHLQREGTLDYTQAPAPGRVPYFGDRWPVSRTMGDVERYLKGNRPNLLFVHVGEPDYAGHRHGWMSKKYGEAVRAADAAVARLVKAGDRTYGEGNWTLIVTADHGGHGRDHGSKDPRDVTIPWISWGKGVAGGGRELAGTIRTFDTASTALWLLGLEEPSDWAGTPIAAAYTAPTTVAAGDR
jgi:predicted AlkP superfamily pyrophosphatase or phosphodiesterase